MEDKIKIKNGNYCFEVNAAKLVGDYVEILNSKVEKLVEASKILEQIGEVQLKRLKPETIDLIKKDIESAVNEEFYSQCAIYEKYITPTERIDESEPVEDECESCKIKAVEPQIEPVAQVVEDNIIEAVPLDNGVEQAFTQDNCAAQDFGTTSVEINVENFYPENKE